jgi:Flp pilus assembly protein TadG
MTRRRPGRVITIRWTAVAPRTDARNDTAGGGADNDADRGSIAAYLVIIAVALFALAGLVLDGGAALAAHGRAADAAQQAARAGADALDESSLRTATPAGLTANPAAARAAAAGVLAAADVTGDITVAGGAVTVTARATGPAAILSIVGIDRVGGTATATAVPLHGTTTGAP